MFNIWDSITQIIFNKYTKLWKKPKQNLLGILRKKILFIFFIPLTFSIFSSTFSANYAFSAPNPPCPKDWFQNAGQCFYCPYPGIPNKPTPGQCDKNGGNQGPPPKPDPTPGPTTPEPVPLPGSLPSEYSAEEGLGMNLGYQMGGASCANISNPIHSATGNKIETVIDYQGSGSSSLKLVRYYNSSSLAKSNMGFNWRHNYERAIVFDNTVSPKIATVRNDDGSEVIFFELASGWTARPGVEAKLSDTITEWTYIDENDNVVVYAKISGSTISLISKLTNLAGRSQSFSYVAGKLDKVTDDFNHSMSFSYDTQGRLKSVTDPALETIQYSYINDNIATVTYQDLKKIQYLYDQTGLPHHLTGIIDQDNNRSATWTYYNNGKGKSSSHGGGIADNVSIVYNADGSSLYSSGLGQKNIYNHFTSNGVQKVATIAGPKCLDCGAYGQSTTYDVNGYKDIVKDYNGNITDYNYNSRGLVEQVIEAKGTFDQRITTTTWHSILHIPSCSIASRKTTSLIYNASNLLQSQTVYDTSNTTLFSQATSKTCAAIAARSDLASLNKRVTNYSYYANGLLKTIDGPRTDVQDVTTFVYDTNGNLTSTTNAMGHISTLKNYTAHGQPQTLINANGLTTTITYDLLGRKDIVIVGSEETNYDYYSNGTLDKITLPDGSFLDYRYDAAKRLIAVYDQLGNYKLYNLNNLGSVTGIEVKDSAGVLKRTQTAKFDLENHLKKAIGAANQTTDYLVYDANGNLEQVQDPGLNKSSFTYDALDRLKTSTDAKLGVITNTYDTQNNLTSVEDPRGLVTSYSYDGLGNRTQTVSPDTGTTKYTSYDANGSVLSMTNALDKTTTYQYDVLGRLDLITYQDGTTTNYIYDIGINAKGRLTSITYNGGATSFAGTIVDSWTYDEYGRVLSKTQTNGTVVLTTSYTYNAITGNLETETTPGGHTIVYTYVSGQVNSISVDSQKVMSSISYDPFGPPTNWDFGNGTNISRIYNKDGQLVMYPEADAIMTNIYFSTGNLKAIMEAGSTIPDAEYTYDAMNRVISFNADGETEGYDYDANNNRILQKINLFSFTSTIAPTSNQLESRTGAPIVKNYSYDLTGNTIADGDHTYGYDARGRLTNMDLNAVEYAINGLGQRIRKRGGFDRDGDLDDDGMVDSNDRKVIEDAVAGNTTATEAHDRNNDMVVNNSDVTRFDSMVSNRKDKETYGFDERFVYNSQGQLEGEYDSTGNVIQEYIWFAGLPVALLRGGEIFYINSDQLGTPISISDQSQEIVWEWDAEPYGRALPDVDFDGDRNLFVFNLRFSGQYYDHESGLHYNINRFYDPSTGRYLESDPIGIAGGINPYSYVDANPVNFIDPLGLATYALSFNVSGGAGHGGTAGINFVVDTNGGFDIQRVVGGGAYAGASGGFSINFERTNADSVQQLRGWSLQTGGSYGEGLYGEGGAILGSNYAGGYGGIGIGGGTPGAGYVFTTYTSSILDEINNMYSESSMCR